MRKFLALAVLTAGLLALNQAFWAEHPTNREDRLADVTRILTGPAGSMPPIESARAVPTATEAPAASTSPSPRVVAINEATPPVTMTGTLPDPAAAPRATAPVAAVTPTISPWQTAVSSPPETRPFVAGSDSRSSDAKEREDTGAGSLVENIQTELKRVGCYDGPVDGAWGNRSKQALQRFIERANASLPVRAPDRIQLSLLKSQPGAVCGNCPKGQTMSGDGACVPNAMLAKAPLKTYEPGRAGAASGWQTAVSGTAQADVQTATATPTAMPAPQPAAVASRDPAQLDFSSRMSVGGPLPRAGGTTAQSQTGSNTHAGAEVAALEDDDTNQSDVTGAVEAATSATESDSADSASDRGSGAMASLGNRPRLVQPSMSSVEVSPRPKASARVTAPRPRAVAARPSRSGDDRSRRYASRGIRSVQSLFTHPLGRM